MSLAIFHSNDFMVALIHVRNLSFVQINDVIESKLISDEELIATIQRCHKENQYAVCPHTAVALSAAYRFVF